MTNQEILEKAIHKAIANGWGPWNAPITVEPFDDTYCFRIDEMNWPLETVIFNHDFAKALWGEELLPDKMILFEEGSMATIEEKQVAWEYHLQQMVVADDPIKYLGENV